MTGVAGLSGEEAAQSPRAGREDAESLWLLHKKGWFPTANIEPKWRERFFDFSLPSGGFKGFNSPRPL